MKNATRSLGLLFLAISVPLTTSAGASVNSAHPVNDLEVLGTSTGNAEESRDLIAEVHQAERDDSGSFLSLTWGIENNGSGQASMLWLRDRSYSYTGQNFAGVTMVNPDGGTRYHPIMDGNGTCLCSGSISNDLVQNLGSGDEVTYWSLFSVPDDIDSVTVEIPNFDPIEDIPIS